ncbi:MAG: peptidase dimerization domain-containing protein [Deltaproteobacteria bacterium]|nr:peptidase dimerization domain-containing protein [Deltaproteobacteria bacterium]
MRSTGKLDERIMALAERDLPLGRAILAEAIRVPADHVDRPRADGGDPLCGLSNHEGPRLEGLRRAIVEHRAVRHPEDVTIDDFGNLVWTVSDPDDGVRPEDKKVIYLDGHSDTVRALREDWLKKSEGALDPYLGVVDPARLEPGGAARAFLRQELGWLPPDDAWGHLLFGRGSADQLGGVVSQILATRILLELAPLGALRGVIVRAYATVCEEDHDGAGPRYVMRHVLPGAKRDLVPDVVILTEGTGDAVKGALGIYRGQRGRMQIELVVRGRSCHGSMPWMGKNPLEHGGAIVAEAARAYERRDGFLDHAFLGHGTRTASWCELRTPSDCAVPELFVARFDRRLTVGETAAGALADLERLDGVAAARAAGLEVTIAVPEYRATTWTGHAVADPQIYPGWITPEDHPAIVAAVEGYRRVVTPAVGADVGTSGGHLRAEPRVDRWIFSTDGVGFPIPVADRSIVVPDCKRWIVSGDMKHPAMFGIGPGVEQNTHKIGEAVDLRELRHAVALLARFPSLYAEGG